jgi:hypothetical protein
MKGITKGIKRLILGLALIAAPAVVVGQMERLSTTGQSKNAFDARAKGGAKDQERIRGKPTRQDGIQSSYWGQTGRTSEHNPKFAEGRNPGGPSPFNPTNIIVMHDEKSRLKTEMQLNSNVIQPERLGATQEDRNERRAVRQERHIRPGYQS